ncbi:MAG: pseudouridine synthase [Patescibacteria group bacterium]
MERLNTFLAKNGVASRRAVDELIKNGRVKVNGVVAELGQKVEGNEDIEVNGSRIQILKNQKNIYILLNKPDGYITTASDERDRSTVLDIIKSRERIFPVGRLDRHTTGVLFLTNDGDFAYQLTHPKHHVEKVYEAILDIPLIEPDRRTLAKGVEIDGVNTQPCEIDISNKDRRLVRVILKEGRNRQIRKMFESKGYIVEKLDRVSCAGITHEGLRRRQWRNLTPEEVASIKSMVP